MQIYHALQVISSSKERIAFLKILNPDQLERMSKHLALPIRLKPGVKASEIREAIDTFIVAPPVSFIFNARIEVVFCDDGLYAYDITINDIKHEYHGVKFDDAETAEQYARKKLVRRVNHEFVREEILRYKGELLTL